jgi:hypothetical protein
MLEAGDRAYEAMAETLYYTWLEEYEGLRLGLHYEQPPQLEDRRYQMCPFHDSPYARGVRAPSPADARRKVQEDLSLSHLRHQILGSRLRQAFAKAHRRLVTGSIEPLASDSFLSFGLVFRFGTAWTKGLSAIRKLVDKEAPTSFDQVIGCLMVADAMRVTVKLGEAPAEQNASREE